MMKLIAGAVGAVTILGVAASVQAADTKYDGTWVGTYHPVQTFSARCNTNTSKRTMTIKDGVATMRAVGKGGTERVYTGTVKGDALEMVSEDQMVYTGTFSGTHYSATTGSSQCTNGVDLDRQ